MPASSTSNSTSPSAGSGSGASSNRTSRSPYQTSAFIVFLPARRDDSPPRRSTAKHPAAALAGGLAGGERVDAVHQHVHDSVRELVRLEGRAALGETLTVEHGHVGERAGRKHAAPIESEPRRRLAGQLVHRLLRGEEALVPDHEAVEPGGP